VGSSIIVSLFPDGKQRCSLNDVEGSLSSLRGRRHVLSRKTETSMVNGLGLCRGKRQLYVGPRLQSASKESRCDTDDCREQETRVDSYPFERVQVLVQQRTRYVDVLKVSGQADILSVPNYISSPKHRNLTFERAL